MSSAREMLNYTNRVGKGAKGDSPHTVKNNSLALILSHLTMLDGRSFPPPFLTPE